MENENRYNRIHKYDEIIKVFNTIFSHIRFLYEIKVIIDLLMYVNLLQKWLQNV